MGVRFAVIIKVKAMQRNIELTMIGIAVFLLGLALFFGTLAKAGHAIDIPEEFDKGEYSPVMVIHAEAGLINKMCGAAIGDDPVAGTYFGCAYTWPDNENCVLMLPTPTSIGMLNYLYVRRHEMAHCWGWSH